MQKIVIDTNVIVSSLIQISYPYRIVHDHFMEDMFHLCMSKELLKEYFEVLSRPKFAQFTIITGNTNDFTFPNYKSTRILTPKEFWEDFRE
jgi:putative PIN family toxin of toxin-antitoxin system